MVLEAAVNGQADVLVTHNRGDFAAVAPLFSLLVIPPWPSYSGEYGKRKTACRSISGPHPRSRRRFGAVETAAGFFRRRIADARPENLHSLLPRPPDLPFDPSGEQLDLGSD